MYFKSVVFLKRLHNLKLEKSWKSDEIKHLVSEVIRSYSFTTGEKQLKKLFNNFTEYWQDYGKNFTVVECSYPVSLEIDGHDINGTIDLIVKDGEGVSLIHFIRTREMMKNYHTFYMELLTYYAEALKERMDVEVENLMLYVLDEAKLYEQPYRQSDFTKDYLSGVVSNIASNSYFTFNKNCDKCEFSNLICARYL